MISFRVHTLHHHKAPSEVREDVASYLRSVHLRLHNAIHAQTRVFTARTGLTPYELQWNAEAVRGETLLGIFGSSVPAELVEAVESKLALGESVRLFIFNSDADLVAQEALVPA
jgi:hypothetical protein